MGNTIDGIVQAECFRSPVDGCLQIEEMERFSR